MDYSEIQPQVQLEIKNALKKNQDERQFESTEIPVHAHTGNDSNRIKYPDLDSRTRFIVCRLLEAGTNTTVANIVGGDFVMPFAGYVTDIVVCVDTAGVTGLTTVDVNKNGATILLTKITIDSTEKTSRTAATPFVLNSKLINFEMGDIFTFDVDVIQTTAAKGLTFYIDVVETSP